VSKKRRKYQHELYTSTAGRGEKRRPDGQTSRGVLKEQKLRKGVWSDMFKQSKGRNQEKLSLKKKPSTVTTRGPRSTTPEPRAQAENKGRGQWGEKIADQRGKGQCCFRVHSDPPREEEGLCSFNQKGTREPGGGGPEPFSRT